MLLEGFYLKTSGKGREQQKVEESSQKLTHRCGFNVATKLIAETHLLSCLWTKYKEWALIVLEAIAGFENGFSLFQCGAN